MEFTETINFLTEDLYLGNTQSWNPRAEPEKVRGYVVIPMLYDEFNRRGKLAEKMTHDLKQLQLEQKLKA